MFLPCHAPNHKSSRWDPWFDHLIAAPSDPRYLLSSRSFQTLSCCTSQQGTKASSTSSCCARSRRPRSCSRGSTTQWTKQGSQAASTSSCRAGRSSGTRQCTEQACKGIGGSGSGRGWGWGWGSGSSRSSRSRRCRGRTGWRSSAKDVVSALYTAFHVVSEPKRKHLRSSARRRRCRRWSGGRGGGRCTTSCCVSSVNCNSLVERASDLTDTLLGDALANGGHFGHNS